MQNLMLKVRPLTTTREIISWVQEVLEAGRPARLGRWVAYPSGNLTRGDEGSRSSPTVTGEEDMGSASPASQLAASLIDHWNGDW